MQKKYTQKTKVLARIMITVYFVSDCAMRTSLPTLKLFLLCTGTFYVSRGGKVSSHHFVR